MTLAAGALAVLRARAGDNVASTLLPFPVLRGSARSFAGVFLGDSMLEDFGEVVRTDFDGLPWEDSCFGEELSLMVPIDAWFRLPEIRTVEMHCA